MLASTWSDVGVVAKEVQAPATQAEALHHTKDLLGLAHIPKRRLSVVNEVDES